MPKQIAFIVACNATILCKGVRAASRALMISLSIIRAISWESWGVLARSALSPSPTPLLFTSGQVPCFLASCSSFFLLLDCTPFIFWPWRREAVTACSAVLLELGKGQREGGWTPWPSPDYNNTAAQVELCLSITWGERSKGILGGRLPHKSSAS